MKRFFCVLASVGTIGVGSVASTIAQDSAPQIISKKGGGVAWKNPAELKTAALAGNAEAQAQYGELLLRGGSVAQNGAQALEFLEKAARAGVASAAFRIGMLLDDGDGVAQDRVRALAYFRAAAAGDVAEAYHNVGAAYAGAHGVKRDYTEALGWLILATKRGASADSEEAVRTQISKLKRPEWIAAGEKRATEIEREFAGKPLASFLPPPAPLTYRGNAGSMAGSSPPAPGTAGATATTSGGVVTLAPVTVSNSAKETAPPASDEPGVSINSPTGRTLRWANQDALQQAADRGEPEALFALGKKLVEEKGTASEVNRGVTFLEQSAKAGSVDAAQQLATLYTQGAKVRANGTKAFEYNLQAARGGSAQAMANTGAFLANGMGTTQNATESLAWLIVAKQHGVDPGSEKRIRDHLVKTAPQQIAVAEKRAAELQRDIEAGRTRAGAR
ncbi:MAG: hypothetical protein ABIO94_02720 [Opitutaceae bacterium]